MSIDWNYHVADGRVVLVLDGAQWVISDADADWISRIVENRGSVTDNELRNSLLAIAARSTPIPAEPAAHDDIDHPPHYGGVDDPYEPIKIIEALGLGFHDGNALKYLLRAGRKPGESRVKDLKKAVWYLNRLIEHES